MRKVDGQFKFVRFKKKPFSAFLNVKQSQFNFEQVYVTEEMLLLWDVLLWWDGTKKYGNSLEKWIRARVARYFNIIAASCNNWFMIHLSLMIIDEDNKTACFRSFDQRVILLKFTAHVRISTHRPSQWIKIYMDLRMCLVRYVYRIIYYLIDPWFSIHRIDDLCLGENYHQWYESLLPFAKRDSPKHLSLLLSLSLSLSHTHTHTHTLTHIRTHTHTHTITLSHIQHK